MSSFSQDDDQSNQAHDEEPVFDGATEAPRTNPLADTFDAAMQHFAGGGSGLAPLNEVIDFCTELYLDSLDPSDPPESKVLEKQLLSIVNGVCRAENSKTKIATEKLPTSRVLTHWQVAQIMLRCHRVIRLAFPGSKLLGALATYAAADGPDRGTYVLDEDELRSLARKYNTQLTLRGFEEVKAILKESAPRVPPCQDRDLIGVNNGILNYKTKVLMDFDPSIVLLAKIRVDYVDSPINPVIRRDDGTTWDIESWMKSLSDDPQRVDLGWHGLGAACRPNVRWNKALLPYNETGNNGKGTYMSLMRNLVGADAWGTLSIADFEDKFRLPKIVGKTAFGADENNVGAFTDKMANFKAVITGDSVTIERKHQDPYDYMANGLVVQCLNSLPKSKDISQSYYRRLLFWKFDKSFEGREDKAIKDDYLARREVLEYVLWKVMNLPDYYELPVPESSKAVLAEFKKNNDLVREFWDEIEEELAWDLLPQSFLHDLFDAWAARTNPRGGGLKRLEFYNRLKQIVAEDGRWEDGQFGTSNLMDQPEPLIADYDLTWWMHPAYAGSAGVNQHGTSRIRKCKPVLKPKYRGLRRVMQPSTASATTTKED
ncbi:putative DNA primase/helicase [Propionibacteriaceae bacterium ES.041]|nr:putative DNA primase/helicase [Propionibacteriaceae bacterium ES.041]